MGRFRTLAVCAVLLAAAPPEQSGAQQSDEAALQTALSLAIMLQSARGVIGANQDVINEAGIGDKGLSGEKVLEAAVEAYREVAGEDPLAIDATSPRGALLRAQMDAIVQVMEENQSTINREDIGFKGFVPAVFARLVNERFRDQVGEMAVVKVTAPEHLVRNRKARPDAWESGVISDHLQSADWTAGDVFEDKATVDGRDAYRVLVPEYYSAGCLSCHGEPAGEIDVTGYPKEGGALNDLGGVISITLFE